MTPEDISRVARQFAIRVNDDESLRSRAADAFYQRDPDQAIAHAIGEIVDLRALGLPAPFSPVDVPAFEDALFSIYERERRRCAIVCNIRDSHDRYWLGRG